MPEVPPLIVANDNMCSGDNMSPHPGGHEIYIFCRPFLGHHYHALSLYGPCPGVMKKIFKEIPQFKSFYPKITSP